MTSARIAQLRVVWAFVALIAVNAVVLWFYLGASASLGWHASLLDEDNLRLCAIAADRGVPSEVDADGARFVGDAQVEFTATVRGEGERPHDIVVRCTMRVRDGEDVSLGDPLEVVTSAVVR